MPEVTPAGVASIKARIAHRRAEILMEMRAVGNDLANACSMATWRSGDPEHYGPIVDALRDKLRRLADAYENAALPYRPRFSQREHGALCHPRGWSRAEADGLFARCDVAIPDLAPLTPPWDLWSADA